MWGSELTSTNQGNMENVFDQLLAKVKDYARRKKLDTVVMQNVKQGNDPMDIDKVGGGRREDHDHGHDHSYDDHEWD